MPPVIAGAVIAGATSWAATGFAIASIGTALASAGMALVLGGISYALTPKPKKNQASQATNKPGTVAVRQSDVTRTYIYGHTRAVRGYAHIESTNNNTDLHVVMILCQGPLRAINEIWVGDYPIPNDWLDGSGNVISGRYAGKLQIVKHLGGDSQVVDSAAMANIPGWTSNDRLQGIAYLYIKLIKDQDVYPTGLPNITAVCEGPVLYDPRVNDFRWSTNIAQYGRDFILADYGYGSNILDIDDTNIAAQMNICDEMVTVTPEAFTSLSIDTATDIISISGDLLTLQYGDRVQVTSSGTLPSGISAVTDYFVIPYQIKTNPRIKLASSLINSMAGTSIDITTAGTGTITITKNAEPRYHGGGSFDSATNLSVTLADIASSMAGRAYPIGGAWTLLAGAWRAPDIEFTIADFRAAGLEWKNALSLSESYNIVKGIFNGAPTLYQDTDYPVASYPTFIEQDLGIESPTDLNLPYVTRPTTAQRIAKIELFRGRQDIAVTCTFSTKAMQVQPGDTIELTLARYGWSAKYFEVTSFAFDVSENGLVCKLGLRETAAAIYDWTSGEAIDFDPAPNTELSNPFDVEVPSGVAYDSTFVETVGGDTIYTLGLQWNAYTNSFVSQYGDFEVQFKLSSDIVWRPSFFVDGSGTATDVVTATAGVEYDLRIRARTNLGVRSGWSTLEGVIVGASGGVTTSNDWGFVYDAVTVNLDWDLVTNAATIQDNWGYVV